MKQKITFLTDDGLQEFVKQELKERFKEESTIENKLITTNIDLNKAYQIMYNSQTIKGCLLELEKGKFNKLEEITLPFQKIKDIIQEQTCKIAVQREGTHEFNSVQAEKEIGIKLQEQTNLNYDFKNPEITINIIINNNDYVLGIDIAGRDLSKRQYKIFNHPNSLKGPVAFSAIMLAGLNNSLLDPYSLSGVIPIEAAIYQSGMPVNYFEKKFALNKIKSINLDTKTSKINKTPKKVYSLDENFKNISAQKKNAKIAGVEKHIEFSRTKLRDLDLKFYEIKPDVMVTIPLESSKRISEKSQRSYSETLFEQAENILTKKIIVLITKKQITETFKFKITKQVKVMQGQQELYITRLEK
ncbi:MAG: THUMP domain-containing protein [Candidatus Woesearchaeota archaeon]